MELRDERDIFYYINCTVCNAIKIFRMAPENLLTKIKKKTEKKKEGKT